MYRSCDAPTCNRYGTHMVTTRISGLRIRSCNGHLELWLMAIKLNVSRRDTIAVATSSTVVVGDIRDWRTRSSIAYDVLRQIGA